MKTKLVLWGSNAAGEKVLIAAALKTEENKVHTWVFPLEVSTEEFHNRLINEWRFNQEVPFPEDFQEFETPLTVSESFLPEGISTDREDIVSRAQAEWHFVVLSSKLYQNYKDEVEEIGEKIEELGEFDQGIWEQLKAYWDRVQQQIHEKTLFHDHGRKLREKTNSLFNKMKEYRKQLDKEFEGVSKKNKEEFLQTIKDIRDKIEQGLGLQPMFEELKNLQKKFRKARFTRDDRSQVWNDLDAAFKAVKEKRYGPGFKKERSSSERLKRRYSGLLAAIEKMEKSIGRDRKDMEFQSKKISESEGQLEAQIRQAKMKMVEERVKSKEEKLAEMVRTKEELEAKMEQEEKREESKKHLEEIEKAKEKVKEKIAGEIKTAAEDREPEAEKLEKAAEELAGKDNKKGAETEDKKEEVEDEGEGRIAHLVDTIQDTLQDAVDTVRAVAEVVEEKIEDKMEEMREKNKKKEKDQEHTAEEE